MWVLTDARIARTVDIYQAREHVRIVMIQEVTAAIPITEQREEVAVLLIQETEVQQTEVRDILTAPLLRAAEAQAIPEVHHHRLHHGLPVVAEVHQEVEEEEAAINNLIRTSKV